MQAFWRHWKRLAVQVTASVEYLDTKRVTYAAEYAARMAEHIAWKYRGYQPKAIYVTDDNALSFATAHLIRLFPNAPVLFSGVNDYPILAQLDPRQVTGVFERKEIDPNLELMRRIAPEIRDIIVLGDDSETFAAIRAEIETQLHTQPDVRAHFISNHTLSALIDTLRTRRERFVFLTTLGAITDDTVSRLGGDEFTIILENIGHEEEAARVAAEILQQAGHPYQLQARDFYVSPSIGIALYPQDGTDAQTLLMNADAAMYRAKETGRNNFQFFNKDISDAAQDHLALSMLLRGALERGEFSLHYQPQIDARDGRVIGFEALLRCNSAGRGIIPPNVFIPILEDNGQIISVGEWVLHTACRWAAGLENKGLTASTIAVNISARQFRQSDLAQIVATALADSGLSAERLELEITESCLMNVDDQLCTMDQLKRLGVQLSIDDFGTGYSSLSYLKRFPVDRLKIDGSFVRDIEDDPDDAVIVTSIIGLARNLDIQVIAEGVETVGQLTFLQAQGCYEIQGYLTAKPMPAEAIAGW